MVLLSVKAGSLCWRTPFLATVQSHTDTEGKTRTRRRSRRHHSGVAEQELVNDQNQL